jgi:O-methyltransferase
MPSLPRSDELDPLSYFAEWPSLRSATGRVDIHSLAAFWVQASNVVGDYYEFGVASGRSAIAAIRAARLYGDPAPERFHLFDSFEGLPELSGIDVGSDQFKAGDYAVGQAQVIDHFKQRHVWNPARIVFYPGWYEASLTPALQAELSESPASIVHIDCDLYESARTVLTFLTPLLQEGTIVLIDDWNCFKASNQRGLRRAVDEWSSEPATPWSLEHYASYGWHGAAFLVGGRSPT